MYKIHFIDKNGHKYDFCQFGLAENETLNDKLEEVLYIMQELTPLHRTWKEGLRDYGNTVFSYHHCEFAQVLFDGIDTFHVKDL